MSWIDEKKPGPKKKEYKRQTVHMTVHYNVDKFLTEYKKEFGVGSTGRLIDSLISSKFAHVKIGDL